MDPLGATASIVQLGETVKSLVDFWRDVKDAPNKVQGIFDEIAILSGILEQTVQEELQDSKRLDPNVKRAAKRCNDHLTRLKKRLPQSTTDLRSKGRFSRTWGSLKVALRKEEIDEILRSIERLIGYLTRLEISSIRKLIISQNQCSPVHGIQNSHCQQRRIADLEKVNEDSTHLWLDVQCVPTMRDNSDVKLALQNSSRDINHEAYATSLSRMERSSDIAARVYALLETSAFFVYTPLYSLSVTVRTNNVTVVESRGNKVAIVKNGYGVLYPSRLLTILGFPYGLWAEGTYTTAWQWTFNPLYAVPESALILEFCRKGYLEGIDTLLKRGDASVHDMDPQGRTPLVVAAENYQVDAVKLLLQEGAKPHMCPQYSDEQPWHDFRNVHMSASQVEKKLLILAAFQQYSPNSFDDDIVSCIMAKLVLYYRPQKSISVKQSALRAGALSSLKQLSVELLAKDIYTRCALIQFMIILRYSQNPLQWMLQSIEGPLIGLVGGCVIPTGNEDINDTISILLEAVRMKLPYRDVRSTKIIMQKTPDLHRVFNKSLVRLSPKTSFATAISIAMRQPCLFFPFVNNLLELGYDLEKVALQELQAENSPLLAEGWIPETLTALFRSKAFPNTHGGILLHAFFKCGRCGNSNEWKNPKMDLPWRRHLRNFRTRRSHDSCCGKNPSTEIKWPPLEIVDANFLVNYEAEDPELVAKAEEYPLKSNVPGRLDGEGNLQDWPYLWVCTTECNDGVCVSEVYENGSAEEPELPLFFAENPKIETGTGSSSPPIV